MKIEKVTGTADELGAVTVFNKNIAIADAGVATLVGCVLLRGKDGGDIGNVGRDIFELVTAKLEGAEGSLLEAIKRISAATLNLVSGSPRGEAGKKLEINFVYTIFYKNVCYIGRHGERVRLLVFDPPNSGEITFESGSGPVRPGQVYLLATEKSLPFFDTGGLKEGTVVDFADIIDGLATKISDMEDQSQIGAAFVITEDTEEAATEDTESVSTEHPRGEVEVTPGEHPGGEKEVTVSVRPAVARNPLPAILGAFFKELRKLTQKDIGAIGRLRRNIGVVAAIIFLILAISAFLTISAAREREKKSVFNMHLEKASSKYGEGVGIMELNRARARERFVEADREIGAAISLFPKDEKAQKLAPEIKDKLKETKETSDINFTVFSDVGSRLNSLSFSGKNLVGVSGTKIWEIATGDKSKREVAAADGISSGFVYDNNIFVIAGNSVYKVVAGEKPKEVVTVASAQDITVFLGNIYLLKKEGIDKFVPVVDGYSGPVSYLAGTMDFGEKSRLAIDGSVWVTNGNEIFKFTRGEKQDFEISGLSASGPAPDGVGASEFGAIYTRADLDNLYVIDTVNLALLVIGKDGVFRRAYQSGEFGRAADLAISDDEAKMYIAVGDKVLEADL